MEQQQQLSPSFSSSPAITTIVPQRTVDETLDEMHTAASIANIERYFDCFGTSDSTIFIGTDPNERWTISEFYQYTKPHFDQGRGWTYTTTSRHITYHNNYKDPNTNSDNSSNNNNDAFQPSTVACFDEILYNERFGTTRNSGVMILVSL